MKSSTSQRAGSSRTFLKTMYLTSGAYVITRRLRTWTLPVSLYSRHRASASSALTRRRLLEEVWDFIRDCAPRGRNGLTDESCIGRSPQVLHHRFVVGRFSDRPYAQARTCATAVHICSGISCPRAS